MPNIFTQHEGRQRGAAVAIAVTFVATCLLGAASSAHALSLKEIKCRSKVSEVTRIAAGLSLKARSECVARRLKFEFGPSVDCMADPAILGGTGTGDESTDNKLAKIVVYRDRVIKKISKKCTGVATPVGVGISDICNPDEPTSWASVARCAAIDVGKATGDALAAMLDLPQPNQPLSAEQRNCFDRVAKAMRLIEKKISLFKDKCYKTADKGGNSQVQCMATIVPPGRTETTFSAKFDRKLQGPPRAFRSKILSSVCDVDLEGMGFPQTSGGPAPDHTGGSFRQEDLFTVVYDVLQDELTRVDGLLYSDIQFCGNGLLDQSGCGAGPGGTNVYPCEECDDGNRLSCDGCDRDCTTPRCGNGAACAPDECDDGNPDNGDGCSQLCVVEECGDGIVQFRLGEECDDGNAINGDGCDSNCTTTGCGNGIVTAGEACDEGNQNSDTDPLAGCKSNCTINGCGNGVIEGSETCDDANLVDGDGCDSNCSPTGCGNMVVTAGELCDDGNAIDGDGCDSNCTQTSCGNGVQTIPEVCDDAGESPTCDSDCTAAQCGDATTNATAGEACDDGNAIEGDGCDSNCTASACGNGVTGAPEECDDGTETATCDADCSFAVCGDSTINSSAGELCDDGAQTASCDSDCTPAVCGDSHTNSAAGETCDDGQETATCDTDCTLAACGDGVHNPTAGEACDDGNVLPGDGCSVACLIEGGD